MTTIKDIAEKLGVSCSTVSRALKCNGRISRSMRDRVFETAEKMGYPFADKGIKNSSRLVGIIAPEIISTNYSAIVNAIISNLEHKGYSGIVGVTNFNKDTEEKWLSIFETLGVAGIIILMNNDSDSIELLKEFKRKSSVPVMQINNFEQYNEYDSLMVSNVLAAEIIAKHLKQLNHSDIAIITDIQACRRAEEIKKQLESSSLIVKSSNFIKIENMRFEQAGYEAARQLLQKEEFPTAIVATYDYLAFGIMKCFSDNGIRIPEDISLISIDNVNTASYMNKSLTTVSMPVNDAGRIATRIMVDRIESGKRQAAIQHVSLNPELIIRDTSDYNISNKNETNMERCE